MTTPVPVGTGVVGAPPCDWPIPDADDELVPCGKRARFAIQRSDHDPSYDVSLDRAPTEACEEHLADTVMSLMDGDDKIHAIIKPRWD